MINGSVYGSSWLVELDTSVCFFPRVILHAQLLYDKRISRGLTQRLNILLQIHYVNSCFACFVVYVNNQGTRRGIEFPFDNSRARCNPHIEIIISSNLNNRYYEKNCFGYTHQCIESELAGWCLEFQSANQSSTRAHAFEEICVSSDAM